MLLPELSFEEIALALAVGLVLGTFPVYGLPTVLCIGAAVALRINAGALQLVNQAATPVQLALFLPLHKAGGWILGAHGTSWAGVLLYAIAGWASVCVPLGFVLYYTALFLLRRQWPGGSIDWRVRSE
jgi:uncharacterized protein (DUF2062 family)